MPDRQSSIPVFQVLLNDLLLLNDHLPSSEDFLRKRLGIVMIVFIAILFRGKRSIEALKIFDASSTYSLHGLPVGSKNKFLFD